MKKILFGAVLLMTACGTATHTPFRATENGSNGTPPPLEQYPLDNTQTAEDLGYGIGPVNLAKSNFYFSGDFQINDDGAFLYDCYVNADIPVDMKKGIYPELKKKYKAAKTANVDFLHGEFRGYLEKDPSSSYPQKLIITYINELKAGSKCDKKDTLVGLWKAKLAHGAGSIELKLNNTFEFTCQITTGSSSEMFSGNWLMTSMTDVVLTFNTITPYMGSQAILEADHSKMSVSTEKGNLEFIRK